MWCGCAGSGGRKRTCAVAHRVVPNVFAHTLLILKAQLELVDGEDEGAPIEDVNVPCEEPYACGWETCNSGGAVTEWAMSTGGTFPNGRFVDSCGDNVDLWDFLGRYIVIDTLSSSHLRIRRLGLTTAGPVRTATSR